MNRYLWERMFALILFGRISGDVFKAAVEVGGVVESAQKADIGDGMVFFPQQPAGMADANFVEKLGKCFLCAPFKISAKSRRAHVGYRSCLIQPDFSLIMLHDIIKDRIDFITV